MAVWTPSSILGYAQLLFVLLLAGLIVNKEQFGWAWTTSYHLLHSPNLQLSYSRSSQKINAQHHNVRDVGVYVSASHDPNQIDYEDDYKNFNSNVPSYYGGETSRRSILQQTLTTMMSVSLATASTSPLFQLPEAASAASSSVPTLSDLSRVQKGHSRVAYLLQNWDSITQVCGTNVMSDAERKQVVRTEGGGGTTGCEKTPLNVQQYMGYKSTEDPLYRIDKLLVKAVSLVDDDPESYLEIVEKYKEKADNTALMAYTSSWGEANPNGGKEVIDDYLERTKMDVVESERYLRQILGYLKLEPLPPSKNP